MTNYGRGRGINYQRNGDLMFVEVKDSTNRVVFKGNFNLNDKNSVRNFLAVIEKFSQFSIYKLITDDSGVGQWF